MAEDNIKQEASENSFTPTDFQETNHYKKIKSEVFECSSEELHHSIDIKEEGDFAEGNEDEEIDNQETDYTCTSHEDLVKREFWMCTLCSYQAFEKSDSERHLKTHMKKYLFTCRSCNLKFSFKSRFRQHLRRHVGDKQFFTFGITKIPKKIL